MLISLYRYRPHKGHHVFFGAPGLTFFSLVKFVFFLFRDPILLLSLEFESYICDIGLYRGFIVIRGGINVVGTRRTTTFDHMIWYYYRTLAFQVINQIQKGITGERILYILSSHDSSVEMVVWKLAAYLFYRDYNK